MNFLEERIMKDGVVKEGNVLKVDSFLNHQMDIHLLNEMGAEFKRRRSRHPGSELPVSQLSILMCRSYLQRNPRASI